MKVAFLILLLSIVNWAEPCSTKDFNDQLGPVRNQSNVGWCFANTGADLLTYAHKQQLLNSSESQVSAIFTALKYYLAQIHGGINYSEVFDHGGFILDAINTIQSKGFVCPQSLDDLLMSTGYKTELKEKFVQFQLFYDLYQDYKKTGSEEKKTAFFLMIEKLNQQGTFLSTYDKEKIKSVLEQPTIEMATLKMVDVVCENKKISISNISRFDRISRQNETSYYNSMKQNSVDWNYTLQTINKVIDNNKPVGIVYPVDKVLIEPKVSSGWHASVISGRTMINGECHYQVRNSWGPDCTHNAIINNVFTSNVNIYSYNCVKGTFWVPEKDLNNLIQEVVFQYDGSL